MTTKHRPARRRLVLSLETLRWFRVTGLHAGQRPVLELVVELDAGKSKRRCY